jgi:hypothetical protein
LLTLALAPQRGAELRELQHLPQPRVIVLTYVSWQKVAQSPEQHRRAPYAICRHSRGCLKTCTKRVQIETDGAAKKSRVLG